MPMFFILPALLLSFGMASAEMGFDEKYERDYNIFNPANLYALDNPFNPAQTFAPDNPFNPANRLIPIIPSIRPTGMLPIIPLIPPTNTTLKTL
jgi:hypothetical protein